VQFRPILPHCDYSPIRCTRHGCLDIVHSTRPKGREGEGGRRGEEEVRKGEGGREERRGGGKEGRGAQKWRVRREQEGTREREGDE
jgi:hypothetical protein